MHKQEKNQEAPCDTCRVELLPHNEEIIDVFFLSRSHLIRDLQGKVIDIDINTINATINLLEIQNKKQCFEQIYKLFHKYLRELQERGEA